MSLREWAPSDLYRSGMREAWFGIVGPAVRTKCPGQRSAQRALQGAIDPKTALSLSALIHFPSYVAGKPAAQAVPRR